MLKLKKFGIIIAFSSTLCVSCIAANYVYTKSAKTETNGSVIVENRIYNLILKAGNQDATCSVTDSDGNSVNQKDVINFFVHNKNVADSNGNHFVRLRKYYISMSQSSDGCITYKLSTTKLDNTYFVCPYFYDKDGNEIEYAYYGKFKGCVIDDKLCSKSGVTPTYNKSIDAFRTYALANGDQYHQTDWSAVFTTQIMLMCIYKTTNMDNILKNIRGTLCDTGTGTQILGIEDIVGNGLEFVDGLVFRGNKSLANCSVSWGDKISDYKADITTNQTTLTGATGTSGGYISKMYYSSGKPGIIYFSKRIKWLFFNLLL